MNRRILLKTSATLMSICAVLPEAQAQRSLSAFEIIVNARQLQSFSELLRMTGVEATLRGFGLFAPTDSTFETLGAVALRDIESNA
jgi:uncharacterized surface protein with fasciclin (FAS1) repeats